MGLFAFNDPRLIDSGNEEEKGGGISTFSLNEVPLLKNDNGRHNCKSP